MNSFTTFAAATNMYIILASFFVAALSVSGALFLIAEMYTPYSGIIKISSAPLRAAIAQLGM
jgi:membrane-bound ClpP family serine protease